MRRRKTARQLNNLHSNPSVAGVGVEREAVMFNVETGNVNVGRDIFNMAIRDANVERKMFNVDMGTRNMGAFQINKEKEDSGIERLEVQRVAVDVGGGLLDTEKGETNMRGLDDDSEARKAKRPKLPRLLCCIR
ncbi:hypothetical protein BKA81DRAFT_362941 [Phyllosticta paracitricarpa]